MFPYTRLQVWIRAHELAVALLRQSAFERSASARIIGGQVRRASPSMAAIVAEGAGSESQASFARYLAIALASSHETEYLLLAARDADVLSKELHHGYVRAVADVKRMLTALLSRVRRTQRRRSTAPRNEQRPQDT
jgi:four helix bundle protein